MLVTHDMGEAAYLADHAILPREGRLEQEGSPRGLMRSPRSEFGQRFIQARRNPLEAENES